MNAKEKKLYKILIENMKLMKEYSKMLNEIKEIYDDIDGKENSKLKKKKKEE